MMLVRVFLAGVMAIGLRMAQLPRKQYHPGVSAGAS